jgi:adenosylmethionine-8-amino-7-oxononanoate aminotransferase
LLLKSSEIQNNIKNIEASHRRFNEKIKDHPKVKNTRQQGVIFALDFNVNVDRYGDLRYRLYDFYMAQGVYLRPLGNTVYILAPFVISQTELQRIYDAIQNSFEII